MAMDIAGQIALTRLIQADLTRAAHDLHRLKQHARASTYEDQVRGLEEVVASLEHLENIRAASATIIGEVRGVLAGLPLAFQNKEKP